MLFVLYARDYTGIIWWDDLKLENGNKATQWTPAIEDTEAEIQVVDNKLTTNMLKPTLETVTKNGVTCTNNGDGTYTLNGTASDTTWFSVIVDAYIEIGKTYKLLGTPNEGSEKARLQVLNEIGGALLAYDTNKGVLFTSEVPKLSVQLRIENGTNVSDLIFKPMLTTDLNATYDDFVPYTGDGETLASDVAEIKKDLSTKIYELAGSELYLCVSGKSCVLTLNGYNLTGSTNFSKLAEYPPYLVARNVVSKEDEVCMISVDPDGNIGASDLQVASSVTGKMFGEVSWVANI